MPPARVEINKALRKLHIMPIRLAFPRMIFVAKPILHVNPLPPSHAIAPLQVLHLSGQPLIHMNQLMRKTANHCKWFQLAVHANMIASGGILMCRRSAFFTLLQPLHQLHPHTHLLTLKAFQLSRKIQHTIAQQQKLRPTGIVYVN